MKHTVFIHTNRQQLVGAKVATHALKKFSPTPERFDVRIICLDDFPHLTKREGQEYLRKGTTVRWNNRDLQSFSPLRFLPPQLMNYEKRAVVMDPDVFAVADICELLERDMGGKSVLCRYVDSGRYATKRPFWATSVMLLECSRLRHWNWDRQIDEMFDKKFDYGDWINLRLEDPATLSKLEECWNSFDHLNGETKLLHTTERSTQPWKTGLPADFDMNYERSICIAGRNFVPGYWLRKLGGWTPFGNHSQKAYLPHPDPNQERLFFSLLRECLENGTVDEAFLRSEMKSNHVRKDAFSLVDRSSSWNFGASVLGGIHP